MFQSGTVTDFAALRASVEAFLSANGWTLANGVLSRGAQFVKFSARADALQLEAGTGQSGAALTGACPKSVKLLDPQFAPITWPIQYDLHVLTDPDEVFLVIRYNVDTYQHLHFGVSTVPGIGGSGAWFGGSAENGVYGSSSYCRVFLSSGGNSGYTTGAAPYDGFGLGFFFQSAAGSYTSTFLHCGLEGEGWKTRYDGYNAGDLLGVNHLAALLYALPSQSNFATALLPIHGLLARQAQGQTIVARLAHARYCRLDTLVAGQIVPYGTERRKCYPLFARNDQQRDGLIWPYGAYHSGTYGVAIRYTGP